MNLLRLPEELIFGVLRQLDVRSLIRCQAVCCRLQAVINHSAKLQYLIVLAATGVHESPSAHTRWSLAERLAMAKDYDAAWRAGKWTTLDIDVPFGTFTGHRRLDRISFGVIAMTEFVHRTIYVVRMPSALRGVQYASWDLTFDDPITDMQIDASQDLLIYTCSPVQLHRKGLVLRPASLTDGGQHPLARDTGFKLHPSLSLMADSIRIYHNIVALCVFVFPEPPALRGKSWLLVIWDWKTGEYCLAASEAKAVVNFRFISNDYIAVPISAPNEARMDVYSIRQMFSLAASVSDGELNVTNLADSLSCSFALPAAKDFRFTRAFFADSTSRPSPATDQTPGALYTDPADVLLRVMVTSICTGQSRTHESWELRISTHKLLSYIAKSTTPTLVPWAEWESDPRRWLRSTHGWVSGMRIVDVHKGRVVISDFHPSRVARRDAQGAEFSSTGIDDHLTDVESFAAQCIATTVQDADNVGGVIQRAFLTEDCVIIITGGLSAAGIWKEEMKFLVLGDCLVRRSDATSMPSSIARSK
ncbi:hypothetical protein FA95DRAFT_1593640 [Auriscalpium vulgare]|uniref:Uncharacterized protein n=1 Tax=Auriscalpium vulgare TaxID=40419 RepID=A0ACB8S2U7_9AGAM|nr:hypothetical protein FA95DRAFT_1593640 [Auriscalpium vulgare]